MRNQRLLFSTASVALCLWPLQGLAQTEGGFTLEEAPETEPVVIKTSSVEVGVGWFSDDSYRFGEYSGITDKGFYPIGRVDFLWRAPFDGVDTRYVSILGSNLGIDSRSARIEAGQQGTFGVFLEYRELPHFQTDDATTPYIGAGNDFLTLPPPCQTDAGGGVTSPPPTPCWDPSTDTPASTNAGNRLTQLDNVLNPVRLKTERSRIGGGFTYFLDDDWSFGASYQREDKDGLESIAGVISRSAILPKPVDYTTQEADFFVAYNSDKLQAQLGYHLSQFDNNTKTLAWENAFNRSGGSSDPDQDYDVGGFGRVALEPDNSAHTFSLAMGYTLSPKTRLAGNLSYTKMLQDDDFLPYAVTLPSGDGIPFGPLPRESLDGELTRIHGALSVAHRFSSKFGINAQYTYEDRDNDTPVDLYCRARNDDRPQDTDCDEETDSFETSNARLNRPYSKTQHDVTVNADYRVLPTTKLNFGYAFQAIERDYTEVKHTYEHTGSVKVNSSPVSFATGWLKYAYSIRDGSNYVINAPVLASFTPEYIAAELADIQGDLDDEFGEGVLQAMFYEANPYARKFYIADRLRHRLSGGVNVMPMDGLDVGLMGSLDLQDYHHTTIGLTDRKFASTTLDVTYAPNEDISVFGFASYDWMKNKQVGYEGRVDHPSLPLEEEDIWGVNTRDRGYTLGIGFDMAVIPDKLKVGADYAYSRTKSHYSFLGDPSLGAEPVPDVVSTLHSFGVRADYQVTDGATVGVFYRYEMYDNDDFALETGSSLPSTITMGTQSLDYSAHLVGLSLRYRF